MIALQSRLRQLHTVLADTLPCDVYHFKSHGTSDRYVVWYEEGEDDDLGLYLDCVKQEQSLTGMIDFFTKTEFDEVADKIQDILNSVCVTWTLEEVSYEDSTNLIHYRWKWSTI